MVLAFQGHGPLGPVMPWKPSVVAVALDSISAPSACSKAAGQNTDQDYLALKGPVHSVRVKCIEIVGIKLLLLKLLLHATGLHGTLDLV